MITETHPSIPSLAKVVDALASARAELMDTKAPPSIPSLAKAISAMADARAVLYSSANHTYQSFSKIIDALADTGARLGNSTSHSIPSLSKAIDALADARAGLYSHTMSNSTSAFNATHFVSGSKAAVTNSSSNLIARSINSTVFVAVDPEDTGLVVASWIILGIFLGLFLYIVVLDMVRKGRTGELQDDLRSTKRLTCVIVKSIPGAVAKGARKMASVFQKKQKESETVEDAAAREKNAAETKAVIDRLAGKGSACVGVVETLARVISKPVLEPLGDASDSSGSNGKNRLFEEGSEFIACDSSASSVV